MKYSYQVACGEVSFILKNMEQKYVNRVPQKIWDLLEKHKIKHQEIKIDLSRPLEEQELSDEAKAMLALFYRKFLCDESEREELETRFQQKLKEEREAIKNIKIEEKIEEVHLDNDAKEDEKLEKIESLPIEVKKEKGFWTKFLNRIKGLFKKR